MDPSISVQIDAQFEKAVSIVQSLPKTGPIQTGYEEKLAMYSLYKQATVGNVKAPRPGIFDMLGRAKWDAWEKQKDVAPHEAKWKYVDTLLKVLYKYSDKTVARKLVQELESYGDLSGSFPHLASRTRSIDSGSSGSASAAEASRRLHRDEEDTTDDDPGDSTAEGDGGETSEDDHDQDRPLFGAPPGDPSFRSPSSLSSHMRYRTPMAGSTFSPPPNVPAMQPLPGFTTPSAFGGTTSPPTVSSPFSASTFPAVSAYPTSSTTYPARLAHSSTTPASRSPLPQSQSLNAIPQRHHPLQAISSGHPDPRTPMERAVEGVQAHIAALTERVEMLEALSRHRQHSGLTSSFFLPLGSSSSHSFLGSPGRPWDSTQMGLWSLIIAPMTRIVNSLHSLAMFIAYVPAEEPRRYGNQRRPPAISPVLHVVRRVILDASFIFFVLGLLQWTWRRTGLRRREVYAALGVLWRALVGSDASPQRGRVMVDRGV